jgi:hypothetical protein
MRMGSNGYAYEGMQRAGSGWALDRSALVIVVWHIVAGLHIVARGRVRGCVVRWLRL